MNTISKIIMCLVAMLVALPFCSQTKCEHKCFTAIFPDNSEVIERQKDGLDILNLYGFYPRNAGRCLSYINRTGTNQFDGV